MNPAITQAPARLQQALELHQAGQLAQAQAVYEELLAVHPGHAEVMTLLGAVYLLTGTPQQALELLDQAIEIDPNNVAAYCNSALALRELKQFDAALRRYDRAIAINSNIPDTHFNRGNVLCDLGRLDAALTSYRRAIAIEPDYAEAYLRCGDVLYELKQWPAALASYEQAIATVSDYEQAYLSRGNVLYELKQWRAALTSYEQAIAIKPDYAEGYCNRGLVLYELKQLDAALASYEQAIAIKPDYAEACFNRGNVLHELKQLDDALASYNQAIAIRPDYCAAHSNRALVLRALKQPHAALASYEQAIAIKPDYAEGYVNRGHLLHELKQLDDALASYNQAITIRPDYAEAYLSRAVVLNELGQWDAALASCNQVIAFKAATADAYIVRGNALKNLGRYDSALLSYEQALALRPDCEWLYGDRLSMKMHLCDWHDLAAPVTDMAAKIQRTEKVTQPFVVLGLIDSARLQQRAAEVWVQERCPASLALPPITRRPRTDKIRLGYYSGDFHASAMTHLMARLFEMHDRKRFEVLAFSFGPDKKDDMRNRLLSAFDEFVDVRAKTAEEIAQLSRARQIDIGVDLMGFTKSARTEMFAHRVAPVQVSYLGYPGTMGAPYIDYLIADRFVIPEISRRHYTEQLVYLPNSYFPTGYQIYERNRRLVDQQLPRVELGLPQAGFVFCCFNNRWKITPDVFDIWMRLLRQVEGSVLWLLQDTEVAVGNLRKEAQARGVSGTRLIFAPRVSAAEHLARHRAADLFIDTLPYNAHTTASDALWAGLPVLTLTGESFVARVAASLLHAVGLPELITTTAEQYESTAIALATDPVRLARSRDKLDRHHLIAPLFDTELLTRHLERAYQQMYERYQRGLSPGRIDLSPQSDEGREG